MGGYKLTEQAALDLESLFVYGALTFGVDQCEAYISGMTSRFEQLAKQPRLYQAVDHIRKGYRRSVYASHSIYYLIAADGDVIIVRILRSQDTGSAFT